MERIHLLLQNMMLPGHLYDNHEQSEKLTDDVRLYRIMPLERFLQMLQDRKNVLVSPSLWDDPFEVLFDEKSIKEIKKKLNNDIAPDAPINNLDYKKWFGQCWCMQEESDALWRVLTQNRQQRSVKIKTSFKDLNKITKSRNKDVKYDIRVVKYGVLEDGSYMKKIDSWINELSSSANEDEGNPLTLVKSLLLTKRKA